MSMFGRMWINWNFSSCNKSKITWKVTQLKSLIIMTILLIPSLVPLTHLDIHILGLYLWKCKLSWYITFIVKLLEIGCMEIISISMSWNYIIKYCGWWISINPYMPISSLLMRALHSGIVNFQRHIFRIFWNELIYRGWSSIGMDLQH